MATNPQPGGGCVTSQVRAAILQCCSSVCFELSLACISVAIRAMSEAAPSRAVMRSCTIAHVDATLSFVLDRVDV